jgi:hypothetical protein
VRRFPSSRSALAGSGVDARSGKGRRKVKDTLGGFIFIFVLRKAKENSSHLQLLFFVEILLFAFFRSVPVR